MRSTSALAMAGCLLVLPGCRMNERMTGTAGGAAGGALLGGVLADSLGGALVGGAAGAIAGYIIGDYLADRRERGMMAAPQAPPGGGGTYYAPAGRVGAVRVPAFPAPRASAARIPAARVPDRDLAEAWNSMGLDALREGDRAEAIDCFRRALAADPSYEPARSNLAREGPR